MSITETSGELSYRCGALRGLGVAAWQHGDTSRAEHLIHTAPQLNRTLNSPVAAAFCLESMAWIVADADPERATVLLGAVDDIWQVVSRTATIYPTIAPFHQECEQVARRALGVRKFDSAFRRGRSLGMDGAVAVALGQAHTGAASRSPATLTKRERQVADLVAQGLSNKQIAARLVISQRTAEGHVEHILTKLAFTSRAQIAAWVTDDNRQGTPDET